MGSAAGVALAESDGCPGGGAHCVQAAARRTSRAIHRSERGRIVAIEVSKGMTPKLRLSLTDKPGFGPGGETVHGGRYPPRLRCACISCGVDRQIAACMANLRCISIICGVHEEYAVYIYELRCVCRERGAFG